MPGAGVDRGAGRQHTGPGVGRRSGDDAEHAAGVLVVARARYRQDGRDVGARRAPAPSASAAGAGRGRCRPAAARRRGRRPRPTTSPRLSAPITTVTSARIATSSTAPVSASTPEAMSTATVTASDAAAIGGQLGAASPRSDPWPPMPTMPSTTRSAAATQRDGVGARRSHRPPARRNSRQPVGVGAVAAEQDRVTRAPRRASARPGEERVAAVVDRRRRAARPGAP